MTKYTVSMFKKSGKWYSDLETIEAPAHSMYVDVAKYIREKYKK